MVERLIRVQRRIAEQSKEAADKQAELIQTLSGDMKLSVHEFAGSAAISQGELIQALSGDMKGIQRQVEALTGLMAQNQEVTARALEQIRSSLDTVGDVVAKTGEANAKAIERISSTIEKDIQTGP